MRYTLRFNSNAACARSHRKISFAILSFKRAWTRISFFSCLSAFFRKTQRVSAGDRRWLRFHLFARQCPNAFRDANLRGRYLETGELAPVTRVIWIHSTACAAWMKFDDSTLSITTRSETEF